MTGTAPTDRLGSLRNGGYVWWIAALFVGMVLAWRLAVIVGSGGAQATGDGEHPETYGFDLSGCIAPRDTLAATGRSKDGLPAITGPSHITVADVARINKAMRGKYLVSSDRVIGFVHRGDACCWPVRLVQWHEIVNDRVGGLPVVVSWSSFTDTACVLERRVPAGDSGRELTFGFSGLVSNAVPLLYDRRAKSEGESLWNPLLAQAVAGPAVADGEGGGPQRLRILHAQLVTWTWWVQHHPATRVAVPPARSDWKTLAEWAADGAGGSPHLDKRYQRDPFQSYYTLPDKLPAPVSPVPPAGQAVKKRLVVVDTADGLASATWSYAKVQANMDASSRQWRTTLGTGERAVPIVLTYLPSNIGRPCVAVEVDTTRLPATADVPELRVRHGFRFAWHAALATVHPGS